MGISETKRTRRRLDPAGPVSNMRTIDDSAVTVPPVGRVTVTRGRRWLRSVVVRIRRSGSPTAWALVAAGLLLVIVRFGAAVALRGTFFTSGFTIYEKVAENLLHGRGFTLGGHPFVSFPPLYPLLVAGAYTIGGHGWWSIALMQTGFDLCSLWFLYALGRRLFGVAPALLACFMFAGYPLLASQSAQLLVTSAFICALLAFLYLVVRLVERPTMPMAVLTGGVAGVGYALRVEMLLVFALLPALLALLGVGRRSLLRVTVPAAAAFLLALSPAIVKNMIDFHRFAPTAAEGGITLWEGNSPHAAAFIGARRSGDLLFALPDAPRPPTSADLYQVDDFWYSQSLHWIRSHPDAFVRGLGVKFVALWSWNLNPLTGGDSRWKQLVYTASYAPVLVLAILGFFVGVARGLRRQTLAIALVLGGLAALHVVVQAFTRMRLPSDPLLMLLAGLALAESWRVAAGFRARRLRGARD